MLCIEILELYSTGLFVSCHVRIERGRDHLSVWRARRSSRNLDFTNQPGTVCRFLPECDEDVGDRLEGGEEGEHDPIHHPFHLKQKFLVVREFQLGGQIEVNFEADRSGGRRQMCVGGGDRK